MNITREKVEELAKGFSQYPKFTLLTPETFLLLCNWALNRDTAATRAEAGEKDGSNHAKKVVNREEKLHRDHVMLQELTTKLLKNILGGYVSLEEVEDFLKSDYLKQVQYTEHVFGSKDALQNGPMRTITRAEVVSVCPKGTLALQITETDGASEQ